MSYTFIYPCDSFNSKVVEPTFEKEYNAIKNNLNTVLVNTDELKSYYSQIQEPAIYRGWMLKESEYRALEKSCNGFLKVSTETYLSSHHLPNWYNNLTEFTPQSIITTENNAKEAFENSGWNQAFIKDYVKSLKTGKGSIVTSSDDVARAINDMHKYRGFVEGGIVLREVHNFIPETEQRLFVVNGKLNAPNETNKDVYEMALQIMEKNSDKFFYSMDFIQDTKGKIWLVEIGDGQVSDCVGWNPEDFAQIFLPLKNKPAFKR